MTVSPYIRLLRPLQWLKNGFVFTPLIFSKHLFEGVYLTDAVRAFVIFCMASSTVYIINDIVDKEGDKQHPKKRLRPIASGEVSVSIAIILAVIILAIIVFLSMSLPADFGLIIAGYLFLQIGYSFLLKHIVIVDIFSIAMGFMLRVLGGAFAIQVEVSHWIVVTTLFLSLFLAASKRRSELVMVQHQQVDTKRKVLQEYTLPFLDALLIITSTGMAISYALYTMADRTMEIFRTHSLIFTTVFVIFGIFRYLFLVMVKEDGENPTAILAGDVPTAVNVLGWLATCIAIIYFN